MILNIGIIVGRIVLRAAPTIEKRQKESVASSRSASFATLDSTPPSTGSVWSSSSRGLLLLQSFFTTQDCPNFGDHLSPAPGNSQKPTKRSAFFIWPGVYKERKPFSSHPCSGCGVIDLPQSFPGQLDIYHPNFDSDDQKQDRIKIDFHDFLLLEKFSSRALLYHVVSLNGNIQSIFNKYAIRTPPPNMRRSSLIKRTRHIP